jgi:hypothetical protein
VHASDDPSFGGSIDPSTNELGTARARSYISLMLEERGCGLSPLTPVVTPRAIHSTARYATLRGQEKSYHLRMSPDVSGSRIAGV